MSLKHAILALLSNESKTGYELSKDVQGTIAYFWRATHQQVYRELATLEKSGWIKHRKIAQEDKPDKKSYTITKAGTKELLHWMKEPSETPALRDSFMIKLFMGHLIDSEVLLGNLQDQQEAYENRLKQFKDAEEKYFQDVASLPLDDQYKYLCLQRGISLSETWLEWSKEVESFLKGVEKNLRK